MKKIIRISISIRTKDYEQLSAPTPSSFSSFLKWYRSKLNINKILYRECISLILECYFRIFANKRKYNFSFIVCLWECLVQVGPSTNFTFILVHIIIHSIVLNNGTWASMCSMFPSLKTAGTIPLIDLKH